LRLACAAGVNSGFGAIELGAFDQAEATLREALAQAERLGMMTAANHARSNLALALARRAADPTATFGAGERDALLAESIRQQARAIDVFDSVGVDRLGAWSRAYIAEAFYYAGAYSDAERHARLANDRAARLPSVRIFALGVLARALAARGERGEALARSAEALAILDELGGVAEGETFVRFAYAETLHRCGDATEARRATADARDRLLRSAATIRGDALRESFLRRVVHHAQTLALAETLGV
jgi:hypothetical protein